MLATHHAEHIGLVFDTRGPSSAWVPREKSARGPMEWERCTGSICAMCATTSPSRPASIRVTAGHTAQKKENRWGVLGRAVLPLLVLGLMVFVAVPEKYEIWWRLAIFALCGALLGWWYWQWLVQRRRNSELQAQAETEKILSGDRLALAAELHDIVSDGLGLQHLRLTRALEEVTDPVALAALSDIRDSNKQTIAQMRTVLDRLQGRDISPPGMPDLEQIFAAAQRHGMELRGTAEVLATIQRLNPQLRKLFIATCREGLANTARHAGPTTVTFQIEEKGKGVSLELVDQGPAPDWQPIIGSGIGLDHLRQRAAECGYVVGAGPVGAGWKLCMYPE